jgi:hypothetical protein
VALGQVFPLVLRFFPVNFIPPVLYYSEKQKKIIIFITGLHNKPQGCGASVASAAGPFIIKKTEINGCLKQERCIFGCMVFRGVIYSGGKFILFVCNNIAESLLYTRGNKLNVGYHVTFCVTMNFYFLPF